MLLAYASAAAAGRVGIAGTVDIPLYAGLRGDDPGAYVEARVGDETRLLRVATGHAELRTREPVEGPVVLGGLRVKGLEATGAAIAGADGEIGLAGLGGAAWALLPSAGVLRLVPASEGATLLAGVGPPLAYASTRARRVRVGDGHVWDEGAPYLFDVGISGVVLRARLAVEEAHSWVAHEVDGSPAYALRGSSKQPSPLPPAPSHRIGEHPREHREISLGGATLGLEVARRGLGPLWAQDTSPDAGLARDVLARFDLAVDPAHAQLALAPVAAPRLADYAPVREAALREALAGARLDGIGPLADFLVAQGRPDEALPLRAELAAGRPGHCGSWLALGDTQLAAARPEDAAVSYTRAAELYQPWSELPLAERAAAEAPQDHACHVAWGRLAHARIAVSDTAGVATLYPARLDLDAGLALAAGTAHLLAGRDADAEAAFRQALKRHGPGEAEAARAGLFLALARRDPALAAAQLARTRCRWRGTADPELARRYAEVAGTQALEALYASEPGSAELSVQVGRARAATGDAEGADRALAEARRLLDGGLASQPRNVALLATRARLRVSTGDLRGARQDAEEAIRRDPSCGAAWLALAEVEAAAGNAESAAAHRRRAGQVAVENPVYATLLGEARSPDPSPARSP